uniref:Pectinesterase n=1 Tax=Cannabis sativa TaxID=3483 RepID=A0A803QLR5_CANSA
MGSTSSELEGVISIGAWGSRSGGDPWSYKPNTSSPIREILFHEGGNIKSIFFRHQDRFISGAFGGRDPRDRGTERRITLRTPSEYLKSISGTYGLYNRAADVILSLSFHTNLSTYGPFGRPSGSNPGTPFTIPMEDSVLVGFHGRAGFYLDAIVKSKRKHFTWDMGWSEGDPFGFVVGTTSWIKQIIVRHDSNIKALSFKDGNDHNYGIFGGKNPNDLDLLETTPTSENIRNDLSQMIDDDVKVHMISLTLCTEDKANKKAILESILKGVKVNVDHHHHSEDENQQGFVIINDFVVVSKDGSWDFTSINDAINAAPSRSYNDGYFLIYVTAGVYSEYVNVGAEKTNLFLLGEGIHKTVITGNRNNADGFSISSSATLCDGFMGANLSVVNAAGLHKEQAVALRNTADHSTFYSCSFEGYQDTLYIHSHRQFYRDCDIYGTVDFIFGNATAIIQNSNIYVRKPLLGQSAVITAHGRTHPTQQSGISIHNSNILPTTDLTTSNARLERRRRTKAFLGRPWRDCARVVYMQSYMDGVIDSAGWHRWDQTDFGLNDAYMGEYNNWGPGSHTEKRPKWSAFHILNTTDAQDFTVSNFIDGDSWLPQTGVPYTGGLI